MKNIFKILLISAFTLTINSCSNEEVDTQVPTIEIITPTHEAEIEPGATINLKAILGDNIGLASYKVEIHAGDDGHEHKAKQKDEEGESFAVSFVKQIANNQNQFEVNEVIDVPENAKEGHYHLGVTVLDVNGNQNQKYVEVFVGHEHHH